MMLFYLCIFNNYIISNNSPFNDLTPSCVLLVTPFTGGHGARHLLGIVLSVFVHCTDPHIMRLIGSAVVVSRQGRLVGGRPVSACITATFTASSKSLITVDGSKSAPNAPQRSEMASKSS